MDAAVTSLGDHRHTTSLTQPTHTLDGEKKCAKTVKFTTALFVCFLQFSPSFPDSDTGSCYKRLATSALLCTRCCSNCPHHAFAKFLNPRNTHNSKPSPIFFLHSLFLCHFRNLPFPFRLDILQEHPKIDQPDVCRVLLTYPFTERRILLEDPRVRLAEMSSESDPLASPLRHLLVLGLSPPSKSSSSSTLGDTSSFRQRTVLRPLPSPPQRSHLQHLLRHLVAQSRGSLLRLSALFPPLKRTPQPVPLRSPAPPSPTNWCSSTFSTSSSSSVFPPVLLFFFLQQLAALPLLTRYLSSFQRLF